MCECVRYPCFSITIIHVRARRRNFLCVAVVMYLFSKENVKQIRRCAVKRGCVFTSFLMSELFVQYKI